MKLFIYPPQSVSVAVPPIEFVKDGVDTSVSWDTVTPANSEPLPVIQLDGSGGVVAPLTDAELRASPVNVSGPLTDAELRATAVPVSGPLTNSELRAVAVPVSGPLNDSELRATPVPVSGTVTANTGLSQPLTDAELRATPVPVSGTVTANTGLSQPLTDSELRATPVPISGTVTANTGLTQPLTDAELRATPVPVSGPITDAELRASAIEVTQTALSGSYQENLAVNTTVLTFTAPAGAKWCKIQADSDNTDNIRVKIGAAATTSSGIKLEPGRSEDFMIAGNISYCSEAATGTNKIYVQFGA